MFIILISTSCASEVGKLGKDSTKKDLPKEEDVKVLSVKPNRGYRYNDVRPEAPEAAMQHLAEAP